MASIMDMISNRDSSLDKSIAETTMQCLKEMRKQTGENVELVQKINSLVEASITKVKGIEAKANEKKLDNQVIEELKKEVIEIKSQFSDELTMIKNQMNEEMIRENNKMYKNVKNILEEYDERHEMSMKSLSRYFKGIIWFLFLITVLLITNILGII